MSENPNTLYFDHEGDFEISVDSGSLIVDVNLIQRIIFTDHANMIRYTFSKVRTEAGSDVSHLDKPDLQRN